MEKPNHVIRLVRVLSGALASLLLVLLNCSCVPKKSTVPNNTLSPIPDRQEIPDFSEAVEIIGQDMAGNNITKETIETVDSITIVITTPMRQLKGTVELTGTSQFNELQLLTENNEAFSFDPQYREKFWNFQSKLLAIKGRTEERTFRDKKTGQVLRKNWFFPAD